MPTLCSRSGEFQDARHSFGELAPILGFDFESLAAGRRERVKAGAAAKLGNAPCGLYPAAMLEAVQRGVKRALIDLQSVLRNLLDAFGDSPAVQSAGAKRAEDEKIKGALEEIEAGLVGRHWCRPSTPR